MKGLGILEESRLRNEIHMHDSSGVFKLINPKPTHTVRLSVSNLNPTFILMCENL